jgi:gliding motility-associated protein GldM
MAGGKETPRQRMMGILYLVLLGLVALQIPDSLLDAFKNITDSLSQSQTNVQTGINNTFDAFEKTKLKEQPERAKPIYDKAKEVSKVASDFTTYVEGLKKQLIDIGGGYDESIHDYKGRADMDISDHFMITQKHGEELRQKVDETRQKLMSLLGKDSVGVNISLNVMDPPKNGELTRKTWQEATFGEGIPMGASITAMTKLQVDAKNAENELVKKILGKVDQAAVTLDKFSAVAVAPSSYIIAGQPYTAQVFLTAFDSKSNPKIAVNGSALPVKDGQGVYTTGTSGEGIHTWIGEVTVIENGKPKTYKTAPQTYQVAKPSAVVSPDKMNVLYIGVPNPLSVSAPGLPKDKLRLSITEGSISGSNGAFVANVKSPGTVKVTVSGEAAPGKTQMLGTSEFRVKRIPDPKAVFAGRSSGSVAAGNIKAQDKVFAKLENFEFDAKFTVTRFTLWIIKPRQDAIQITSQGADLSGAMKSAMATVTPGTRVIFANIVAVGPDGTQRGLEDISLLAN